MFHQYVVNFFFLLHNHVHSFLKCYSFKSPLYSDTILFKIPENWEVSVSSLSVSWTYLPIWLGIIYLINLLMSQGQILSLTFLFVFLVLFYVLVITASFVFFLCLLLSWVQSIASSILQRASLLDMDSSAYFYFGRFFFLLQRWQLVWWIHQSGLASVIRMI